MASNLILSEEAINDMVDAMVDQLDSGKLNIYTASQPADPDTAITDQTLLAELVLNATAFGAASGGVATAGSITADSSANATGTAAWFRIFKSNDDPMIDGSVGTSDADLILNSTAIQSGAEVSVSSLTITLPDGS